MSILDFFGKMNNCNFITKMRPTLFKANILYILKVAVGLKLPLGTLDEGGLCATSCQSPLTMALFKLKNNCTI